MSIKAQIWDLEGVLLRSVDGSSMPDCVARRLNAPVEAVRAIFLSEFNDRTDLGEFRQIDFWHHMLDTLGKPRSDVAKLWEHLEEDLFIDQQLLEVVRRYRKTYKTALVSNYSEVLRPLLETRWRVDGAFDEIIISQEVGLIKPMPAMFSLTLQRLGCQLHEAVLIDDRAPNIEGARQFGLHTVFFENRDQTLAELESILAQFK